MNNDGLARVKVSYSLSNLIKLDNRHQYHALKSI